MLHFESGNLQVIPEKRYTNLLVPLLHTSSEKVGVRFIFEITNTKPLVLKPNIRKLRERMFSTTRRTSTLDITARQPLYSTGEPSIKFSTCEDNKLHE